MAKQLKAFNELLGWVNDLITLFSNESIKIPNDFHDKVSYIQKALNDDVSGLVNTILDFCINSALVDYKIETSNAKLTQLLTDWLQNINSDIRGTGIEVGINGLAKQYFIERWKNSSLCVLRTIWEEKEIGKTSFILPTKLWFADGKDILVEDKDKSKRIGTQKYILKSGDSNNPHITLPSSKYEHIFVQKPYSRWGDIYPTPYLIQRGIYHNLEFLRLLSTKGEYVVGKALEYLMILKKGSERLFTEKGVSYSEKDLKDIKDGLKKIADDRKTEGGITTYATQFDTDIQHLIPEYSRILQQALYSPIEKKILAGLGLIDVVDTASSSRRESVLNPKSFIQEAYQGIADFKSLIRDVLETIKEKNDNRRKYMGNIIEITNTPIQAFITDGLRQELRLAYTYGQLSHKTYIETVCGMDYDLEVERRKLEDDKNIDEVLYPHLIQNKEGTGQDIPGEEPEEKEEDEEENDDIPIDKKTDKDKYKMSNLEKSVIVKKKDGWHVLSEDRKKKLGGPYKTRKEALKRLRQVEFYKNKGGNE